MKRCTKCQVPQPPSEFSPDPRRKDGLSSHCRTCHRAYSSRPDPDPSLPGEEWRTVKGYEGIYEVSSLGRVRRIKPGSTTYPGRVLTPSRANRYAVVILTKDGASKLFKVHHLVAQAFLEPVPGKPYINHIDGYRYNNRKTNLEYCTHLENMIHAYAMGLIEGFKGDKHPGAKLTEDAVRYIREQRGIRTGADLARQFGITRSQVSSIQHRKTWQHID